MDRWHWQVGTKQWRYYDFGPKVVPPLICLPGTPGTADVYYKQIMSLSMKGYSIISVDIPHVWNHTEWIQTFEKFLDAIDVHHIHLYGTSLGGFLAQPFVQHRPSVSWTPSFLLKRYVLTGICDGPQVPFITDSVDFVVSQVETLSKEELASRLTLTTTNAQSCLSETELLFQHDQLSERYFRARRAYLKTDGYCPFRQRPDEFNLHLQLHLRNVGVEARPVLVRSNPKGGLGGSPSKENDGEDPDESRKDNGEGSENPYPESQIPPSPESLESNNLDNQPLKNSENCHLDGEVTLNVFPGAFICTGFQTFIG